MKQTQDGHNNSLVAYTTGFILSIILTVLAFYFVKNNVFSGTSLMLVLATLAVGQLLVQLLFFLHLGRESKPKWNLWSFMFMLLVVLILVIGSLWIMHNLDYNMHTDIDSHIMDEENIYR